MPWVRIDENAMDHPKIGGLPDGAFRLWVEALSYCQKFLTDGLVNAVALKGLRSYSPKRRAVLVSVGLWNEAPAAAVSVHDFLEWNESRDRVLQARTESRDRRRKWRERHASPDASQTHVQTPNGVRGVVCRDLQLLRKEEMSADSVEMRAGRFCQETYPSLYEKHRKGARYVSKPHLDFQEALELCRVWDDARLEQVATVFLTTDHEFAEKGSRTMAQFRAMASWCDSKLVEAGIA